MYFLQAHLENKTSFPKPGLLITNDFITGEMKPSFLTLAQPVAEFKWSDCDGRDSSAQQLRLELSYRASQFNSRPSHMRLSLCVQGIQKTKTRKKIQKELKRAN